MCVCIRACVGGWLSACARMCARASACARVCMRVCARASACACVRVRAQARVCVCARARVRACVRVCHHKAWNCKGWRLSLLIWMFWMNWVLIGSYVCSGCGHLLYIAMYRRSLTFQTFDFCTLYFLTPNLSFVHLIQTFSWQTNISGYHTLAL